MEPEPEPDDRMARAEAETIAAGLTETGVLAYEATTRMSASGELQDAPLSCPGGGAVVVTGKVSILDPRELSLTMESSANMEPAECAFPVDGGGYVEISGSLSHTGSLRSDSTDLHVDVRESGDIAWSAGDRSGACRLDTQTTATVSLIIGDTPPAPAMLIEGQICDVVVSVSAPLFSGIWIR